MVSGARGPADQFGNDRGPSTSPAYCGISGQSPPTRDDGPGRGEARKKHAKLRNEPELYDISNSIYRFAIQGVMR
jgi:hypothetical protein